MEACGLSSDALRFSQLMHSPLHPLSQDYELFRIRACLGTFSGKQRVGGLAECVIHYEILQWKRATWRGTADSINYPGRNGCSEAVNQP